MVSFFLTLARFFRGLHRAWSKPNFRSTLLAALLILLSGTFFYSRVEGWSLLDSLYFCVMHLTTIGTVNLSPSTDASKIFTMFYLIIGIGVYLSLIMLITRAQLDEED